MHGFWDKFAYFVREFKNQLTNSRIIILEKTGEEDTSIHKIHPSKVVPHIFQSSIRTSIEKFTERQFSFFTGLLNDVSCYKVNFGTDMKDFYNKIKEIPEIGSC